MLMDLKYCCLHISKLQHYNEGKPADVLAIFYFPRDTLETHFMRLNRPWCCSASEQFHPNVGPSNHQTSTLTTTEL